MAEVLKMQSINQCGSRVIHFNSYIPAVIGGLIPFETCRGEGKSILKKYIAGSYQASFFLMTTETKVNVFFFFYDLFFSMRRGILFIARSFIPFSFRAHSPCVFVVNCGPDACVCGHRCRIVWLFSFVSLPHFDPIKVFTAAQHTITRMHIKEAFPKWFCNRETMIE